MKLDMLKIARALLLNEKVAPSLGSYIQALAEDLANISPKTLVDSRRLEMAKENLLNIKRHSRRLEERISSLEEEIKVLQEKRTKRK